MSRRVELITGTLSAALGLIALAYMLSDLNSNYFIAPGDGPARA